MGVVGDQFAGHAVACEAGQRFTVVIHPRGDGRTIVATRYTNAPPISPVEMITAPKMPWSLAAVMLESQPPTLWPPLSMSLTSI